MGYLTSGNVIVDAMGAINISGNIIPAIWYRTITKENGKPYPICRLPFASARQSNENSRYPYENKKMKPTVWAVNL